MEAIRYDNTKEDLKWVPRCVFGSCTTAPPEAACSLDTGSILKLTPASTTPLSLETLNALNITLTHERFASSQYLNRQLPPRQGALLRKTLDEIPVPVILDLMAKPLASPLEELAAARRCP